jgi:hypothetical protein
VEVLMAKGLLARFAQKQPGPTHNVDPRYKAAARAPAAQVLRGLLAPQQLAEMALAFAPGSGDAMAVRDGQQNFADMRKSIEGGDYGKAASDAIYGTTAYASALPVLGAAIPHFGGMVKAARGASRGLRANDLPKMLDGLGYKYNVENSQFMSDQHGPSLSSYYTVETPSGAKRFRVSDHADGALVEGRTDLRLGANADEQMLDAFNALGVDAPQSVVDGAALSRSERLATQQKRNAAILDADTAAKRARVETQAAELAALGAGHLTGRSRRQAIAALNMKSDRKKRQAIAEIVAADLPSDQQIVRRTVPKKQHY